MNFSELILQRFSVRRFRALPIENEKLMQVLDAGRLAPSAVNYQPWYFIVIADQAKLEEIYTVYKRDWIRQAPLIIVICADHAQSWKRSFDGKDSADIDAAIATDHMTLMAAELGLGTCWVCHFDAVKCSEILKLPDSVEPIALLPIGYPDTKAPKRERKPLSEVVHLNEFGKRLY